MHASNYKVTVEVTAIDGEYKGNSLKVGMDFRRTEISDEPTLGPVICAFEAEMNALEPVLIRRPATPVQDKTNKTTP